METVLEVTFVALGIGMAVVGSVLVGVALLPVAAEVSDWLAEKTRELLQ